MIDHPALRRLLDLDEPETHDRAAAYLVTAREVQLYVDLPVIGAYDPDHLQAIHRFLHHDAHPRTAGLLRPDPALRGQLAGALEKTTPERLSHLQRDELAGQLGGLLTDLAVLDPFHVGTGRAARAYTNVLANESGWVIRWQRLTDQPQLASGSDPRHTLTWLLEPAAPGTAWRDFTRQLAGTTASLTFGRTL
jgi:fido (protein-threonine AMPylation protein)